MPFEPGQNEEAFAASVDLPVDAYPNLVEMLGELVMGKDYSYASEFDYGLELILDGLAQRLAGFGRA